MAQSNPTNVMRLSPVALGVIYTCRGMFIPRPMVSGWVYVGAGGPFGAHRPPQQRIVRTG